MIGFKCPHCQVEYDVKEKYASIATKCPNCHKGIIIPELTKEDEEKSSKS